MYVQLFPRVLLDVVENIMTGQRILLCAQLCMNGGKALSRSVIVNQQVVDAQYLFVGQYQCR